RRHVIRRTPPTVDNVSGAEARASAATRQSFRTLLPPNPKGIASSRLTKIRGAAGPRAARKRVASSSAVGGAKSGSAGSAASVASAVAVTGPPSPTRDTVERRPPAHALRHEPR